MASPVKRYQDWLRKAPDLLKKYRYPILVLLAGLVLAAWPFGKKQTAPGRTDETKPTEAVKTDAADYRTRTEAELEQILSQIEGAGRVRVMLTLRAGPETVYQTDVSSQSQSEDGKTSVSSKTETVILSRGSSYNEPAVVRERYPQFQGALIVSEGGGSAGIRLQLVSAVSALLGLGTDQITVVKMK